MNVSNKAFDKVVRNAVDFLRQSVTELQKTPKFSIIHFCTSLELFLKARLMKEHWALAIEDPSKADLKAFTANGKFKSVGLDEALNRLQKIAGQDISKEARTAFTDVRDHRNRVMHFYNESYHSKRRSAVASVVTDQCRAWFHLHALLTVAWRVEFNKYQQEFYILDKMMLKLRLYLKAKFEELASSIAKKVKEGTAFTKCSYCGYVSSCTCLTWSAPQNWCQLI